MLERDATGRFGWSLPKMAELAAWFGVCLFFALFVATGDWIGAAGLAGLLVLGAALTADLRFLAVVWIVGIPTLFVFPNNVLRALPFVTTDRVIFVVLVGMVFLGGVFATRPRRPLIRLEWVIVLLLLAVFLSMATTLPGKDLREMRGDLAMYVQGMVMPMATFLVVRRLRWTERDGVRLLRWLVAAGVFVSVVGALQIFLGVGLFTPLYFEVQEQGRATATFANAPEYASVLGTLLLVGLMLYLLERDALVRAVVLMAVLIMIGGLLLSQTRANYLAALASMGVVYVLEPRIRPLMNVGAVLGGFALMVAVPFILDSDLLQGRLGDMSTVYARSVLYATSINMMISNPFLGIGFARYAYLDAKPDYLTDIGPIAAAWGADVGAPHNDFLFVGAHTGVLGLTLYIVVLTAIARLAGQIRRAAQPSSVLHAMAILATANLVNYVVVGLFVDFMFFNYFGILMFFILGVAAALHTAPDGPTRAP